MDLVSDSDKSGGPIPKKLVAMISYSVILATLVITVPLTQLGAVGASLNASGGLLNWVVIIGSLSGAIGTGLLPPLASIFGQRTMTVITMGMVAVGGLIAAVAPNMTVLLIGRFINGAALGSIALSLAIARANITGRRLSTVLSWIAAAEGIAAGLSFVLGGLLTDTVHVSWRVVFWLIAALGAIGVIGALPSIPRSRRENVRVDWFGGLLLAAGLALILVPLSMGSTWGWDSGQVIGMLVAGVVVAAVWWLAEERIEQPLVNTRALRNRNFLRGWLVFFLAGALAWIINFTVPTFTEAPSTVGFGFGYNALVSGYLMLMFCAGIVVGSWSAGPLSRVIPARVISLISFTGCAVGMLLLAFLHSQAWELWTWLVIVGLSYGMSSASAYLTFIHALRPSELATAASIGQISGPLGGAIGSASITAVLTAQVVKVGASVVPSQHSFQLGWLIGVGVAVVGFLLVALIRQSQSAVAPAPITDNQAVEAAS